MNHAPEVDANMLVILNDNDMSISPNVGAMNNYLTKILSSRTYSSMREESKKVLSRMPSAWEIARRTEEHMKGMIVPGTLFEELGFNYIGPIDGHDLPTLIATLRNMRDLKGPQFLHIVTKKGKGFAPAENDPLGYHAITSSNPWTPRPLRRKRPAGRSIPKCSATGCATWPPPTSAWSASPPPCAKAPTWWNSASVSRSATSTWRLPNNTPSPSPQAWPAKAQSPSSRSTPPSCNAATTSLSTMSPSRTSTCCLPSTAPAWSAKTARPTPAASTSLTCAASPTCSSWRPSDENECRQMLTTGFLYNGPAAVRYPRGKGPNAVIDKDLEPIEIGKGIVRRQGSKVAFLVFGVQLAEALKVAEKIDATVVDMRFVKPLDEALVREIAGSHELLVTVEENAIMGGAGAAVSEFLARENILKSVLHLGLPDVYVEHAKPAQMLAECGLDEAGIEASVRERMAAAGPVETGSTCGSGLARDSGISVIES